MARHADQLGHQLSRHSGSGASVDQSHLRRGARTSPRWLDCDWRRGHLPALSAATGREDNPERVSWRSPLRMTAPVAGLGSHALVAPVLSAV